MTRQFLFDIFLLLSCAYAFLRGGLPERITGILLLAGDLLSVLAVSEQPTRFHREEFGLLAVDCSLFVVLWWISVRSTRWWPLFLAGLQLDAVIAHGMRLFASDVMPISYLNAVALWSYPMLAALVAGACRHQRRLHFYGRDSAWKAWRAAVDTSG
ncbi:MAG: hypothetical protein ABT11_19110 [Novosphingobium sp. SCN 66-18]|nr:MAG: hypothetical protein ABT11_19110 [Novosphingobium sp. SCN 66-18]